MTTPLSRVWMFEGVKPRASELLLAGLGYLDGLGDGEWLVGVVTWVAEGDLAVTRLVGGLDYPTRLLDALAIYLHRLVDLGDCAGAGGNCI